MRQGNVDQGFFCLLNAFSNRFRHFVGFAETDAHAATRLHELDVECCEVLTTGQVVATHQLERYLTTLGTVATLAPLVNAYLLRFYFLVAGMPEDEFVKRIRASGRAAHG